VLALTATAAPNVRDEIIERLGMRNAQVFIQGFDHPNISLRVDHFSSEADKIEALAHRVRWADKPGIVYVATRNNAEQIMRALAEQNVQTVFYHARFEGQRPFADSRAFHVRGCGGDRGY
jgi:ATP-dependent DNA helicase RecQ